MLVVDGTNKRAVNVAVSSAGTSLSGTIMYTATGLSAGSHTFAIIWSTSGGTAQVRPATTNQEFAQLHLEELTI
jgi:hypothetical protein